MIDYRAIVDELDEEKVKALLTKMDIPFTDKGSFLLMPTVCHHSDEEEASWKLYYYKDTKFFMCYTECGGMSIFNFIKNYYEVRNIEYNWYEDIYKLVVDCSDYKKDEGTASYHSIKNKYVQDEVKPLEVYSDKVLDCFMKTYPQAWIEDGISKAAMDKYNILYSISQNKIIIPHYDINGNLVGIRGRAQNEDEIELFGKYAPVQVEGKWYSHPLSLNLYGLNVNQDNIKNTGICFLCESEKSVLQAESFSLPNCAVAVCGSNFNKYALKILMRACSPREIVICFDKEQIGNGEKYFNKLENICKKYSNYTNFSFIYDTTNLLQQKDSPTDRGEKIFRELLERRYKVK